jgi:hypothetical protein
MPFLTYLVRRTQQQQQQTMNKRSMTLPIIKKKKEIGDYVLGKTIGRGSSGNYDYNLMQDITDDDV